MKNTEASVKASPSSRTIRLALLAAIVALLSVAALTGCSGCSKQTDESASNEPSSTVTSYAVPDVTGMTADDASRLLTATGFVTGNKTEVYSDTVESGYVISQTPSAGAVVDDTASTKVALTVSKGKQASTTPTPVTKQATVPDLTGMTQTQAETALIAVGLVPRAADAVYADGKTPGQVFAQDVDAGTIVDTGTTVTFTAALGTEIVSVPIVVGLSKDDAMTTLTDQGFDVDMTDEYSSTVAAGSVISQNPNPKLQCLKGSTVTICISQGPQPAGQVAVPDLTTYDLSSVITTLDSAGLVCKATGDLNGTVISQDIVAGTLVDKGTAVTVTLEGTPVTVTSNTGPA